MKGGGGQPSIDSREAEKDREVKGLADFFDLEVAATVLGDGEAGGAARVTESQGPLVKTSVVGKTFVKTKNSFSPLLAIICLTHAK